MEKKIKLFLDQLRHQKKYSENTIESYQNDILSFSKYLKENYDITDIIEANEAHIRSWFSLLIENKYKASSLKRKKAALSSLYKFLQIEEDIKTSPIKSLKLPKAKQRLATFVTESNLESIFEHEIETLTEFEDIRNRIIIEIFYSTGIRVSELIEIKKDSFNGEISELKIIGKGNKQRIIPILPELKKMLEFYTNKREEAFKEIKTEEYFILTKKGKKTSRKFVYRVIYSYLSKITTQTKKSPHVMRHTFATHLLNHGAELNAIKDLLGHSSLAATQLYTHNSIEQLKTIYKNTHPHIKKRRKNENHD